MALSPPLDAAKMVQNVRCISTAPTYFFRSNQVCVLESRNLVNEDHSFICLISPQQWYQQRCTAETGGNDVMCQRGL